MNPFNGRMIVDAVQKAANAAADKGVTVTVEIHEKGFMDSESLDVTIKAEPPKKAAA